MLRGDKLALLPPADGPADASAALHAMLHAVPAVPVAGLPTVGRAVIQSDARLDGKPGEHTQSAIVPECQ